ncbi:DUF2971 domain-containing protein [Sellimonas intestinalis]|uniref:DUF2971 domain-containing protein n=1 Tax=Sellimonas intestinalis TaxID=1653434 RepID=UPI0022E63E12|nr:DUF2971 domain-containing protein [Sellimonas intestinalis]
MSNWRKTYGKMLYDKNITNDEVRDFVKKYLPKKLYRFRKFDDYWKDCIYKGEVYFSRSSELNDPFDCLTYVDMEKYLLYLKKEAKKCFEFLDKDAQIDSYFNNHGVEDVRRDMERFRDKIGVACFTENVKSPVMWAHYSDSHKGFCIEYETDLINPPMIQMLLPVFYDSNRFDATNAVIHQDGNTLLNPYFVKAKDWSYEKEWRIIITESIISKLGKSADFSDKITGIYFGLEIEKDHSKEMQEIISWAKNNGIKVYKMRVHPREYEMYPKEI